MDTFSLSHLGIAVAGLVILALVALVARTAHRASIVRAPVFKGRHLTLAIDETAGDLVLTMRDNAGVVRMALGSVVSHYAPDYAPVPVRAGRTAPRTGNAHLWLTSFKVPDVFEKESIHAIDSSSRVARNWDRTLPESEARLAHAWLDRRAALIAPDFEGHVRTLNAQKKEAAAAARRHLPERPVIECDRGRVEKHYAYVAFLPSGFVYGTTAMDGLPVPVTRVHASIGRRIEILLAGQSSALDFELTQSEMETLQKLQQEGRLNLEPPILRGR